MEARRVRSMAHWGPEGSGVLGRSLPDKQGIVHPVSHSQGGTVEASDGGGDYVFYSRLQTWALHYE